jgi:hypothetical protein
MGFVVR